VLGHRYLRRNVYIIYVTSLLSMPKTDYHLSDYLSLHGENSSLRRGSLGAKLYWPGNETKGAHYAWGPRGTPRGIPADSCVF